MSRTREKNEFSVMRAFVAALPNMDESALSALLGWLKSRGDEELEKRKRAAPPTSPA